MGPPARAGAENEHGESKPHDGYNGHQDADEGEYIHSASDAHESFYCKPNPASGPVHTDPAHVSPDMNSSPHPNGHGSSTPRTTSTYTGYQQTTPRQSQLPSSNLNYVMSNDARAGAQNGADAGYQSAYPSAPPYPAVNGTMQSNKRGREVDDQDDPYGRPISAGGDASLKRQRTDPSVGMAPRPISQPQSAKVGGMRR
jgi:protein SOK2